MHAAATPLPPAGLRGRGEVRTRPVSTEGHIQGPESNQTTTTRGKQQEGKVCVCPLPAQGGLAGWGGEAPELQVRWGGLRSPPHTCPFICGNRVCAAVTAEVTGELLGSPLAPAGPSPG